MDTTCLQNRPYHLAFCWGGVEVCVQIWSNGGGKVPECLFKTPWPNFIFRDLYGQIDHVQNISVLQAAFNGFSTIVPWHHIGMMKGSNETLAEGIPDDLDVSENGGTPKSSILIGFSAINHPFWGTPIFGNIHLKKTS